MRNHRRSASRPGLVAARLTRFVLPVAAACAGVLAQAPVAADLWIENVALADPADETVRPGMTVWIDGGTIRQVGPAGDAEIPAGARRIDGRGRFLIPGLSDMHVHLDGQPESYLPLLVVHGVTRVRDMGGDLARVASLRQRIEAGDLVGPRIVAAGPILESRDWLVRVRQVFREPLKHRIPFSTPEEADLIVDLVDALGADFIKIRNAPSPHAYRRLIAAARDRGLDVVGHEPANIPLVEAIRAGQRSIEHIPWFSLNLPGNEPSAAELDELISTALEHGAYFTPTQVAMDGRRFTEAQLTTRLNRGEPEMRYVSQRHLQRWRDELKERAQESGGLDWRAMLDAAEEQLRRLHRGGVPMMTGTDLGPIFIYPGPSLHAELRRMVDRVGMTPREALRSSTSHPARFLGVADREGRIAEGYAADLVLLAANPFEDVSNAARIEAVVLRGELLDAQALRGIEALAIQQRDAPLGEPAPLVDLRRAARGAGATGARLQLARYLFAEGDYSGAIRLLEAARGAGVVGDEVDDLLLSAQLNRIDTPPGRPSCGTVHDLVDARLDRAGTDARARLDLLSVVNGVAARQGCTRTRRRYLERLAELETASLDADAVERHRRAMVDYELDVNGDARAALAYLEALQPDGWQSDPGRLNNLAWWCFERNVALDRARVWAERAIELEEAPESRANVMDTLAEILNAAGDPAAAAAVMERADRLFSTEHSRRQVQRFRGLAD